MVVSDGAYVASVYAAGGDAELTLFVYHGSSYAAERVLYGHLTRAEAADISAQAYDGALYAEPLRLFGRHIHAQTFSEPPEVEHYPLIQLHDAALHQDAVHTDPSNSSLIFGRDGGSPLAKPVQRARKRSYGAVEIAAAHLKKASAVRNGTQKRLVRLDAAQPIQARRPAVVAKR